MARTPLESVLFGVAVANDTALAHWQETMLSALRVDGAQDIAHYVVSDPDIPTHNHLLLRRASRRASSLRPAVTGNITWEPWRGRHVAALDFVLSFLDGAEALEMAAGTRLGCWFFSPHLDPATTILDGFLTGKPLITVGLYCQSTMQREKQLLFDGVFRCDLGSFTETLDSVLTGLSDWPQRALRAAASGRGGELPSPPAKVPEAKTLSVQLAPVRILLARANALLRRDVWNVGTARWPGLDPRGGPMDVEPTWLPDPPRGRFLADPFPLSCEGERVTIIAEDFDYSSRTGRIVTVDSDLTGRSVSSWRPAFSLPHHGSYPFLVQTPDGMFCVPECLLSEEVAAWRLQSDHSWKKIGALIFDRRLVDSTITFHEGRWWLFATDQDRGPNTNLYGWYADRFSGPWRPHQLNPLKSDVRSSRPAGPLFKLGDRLIRPAQDCSITYGGQIVLNEVLRLDEIGFAERIVGTVRISAESRYPQGPHTLTFLTPDVVLLDGKRVEFGDPLLALRALSRSLVRVGRRTMMSSIHSCG